jgi:phospholipid/cholesterol/gamma-HCH transport system ATP-binding protein
MNTSDDTGARATEAEPIVVVKDLTIGWGDDVLIEHVSFEVQRGEVFAILGGSGSGKSTLVRFLIGLEPIRQGEVVIAGRRNVDLDAGLPPFGVMFQSGALFGSATVRENVQLPLEEWTRLAPEAIAAIADGKLELVGLEGAFDKMPSELSGGMRKRVAIARALALEPDLVFLDEPSAGLDPLTSAALDDLILTLTRALGLTVVMVTHELESVFRVARRCILLDNESKSIIARGDPCMLAESTDPRVSAFFNPGRKTRGAKPPM